MSKVDELIRELMPHQQDNFIQVDGEYDFTISVHFWKFMTVDQFQNSAIIIDEVLSKYEVVGRSIPFTHNPREFVNMSVYFHEDKEGSIETLLQAAIDIVKAFDETEGDYEIPR